MITFLNLRPQENISRYKLNVENSFYWTAHPMEPLSMESKLMKPSYAMAIPFHWWKKNLKFSASKLNWSQIIKDYYQSSRGVNLWFIFTILSNVSFSYSNKNNPFNQIFQKVSSNGFANYKILAYSMFPQIQCSRPIMGYTDITDDNDNENEIDKEFDEAWRRKIKKMQIHMRNPHMPDLALRLI